MRRDFLVTVKDVDRVSPPSLHLDSLADEAEGHGVPVRRQTDQIVFGHDPRDPGLLLEAALVSPGHQMFAFSLKPYDRRLMRGPMKPTVGDRRVPFVEVGLQVHEIDERPSRQEVPLQILHARFDCALSLRPVRPTHSGLKAPVVGKRFEGRIPEALPRLIRIAHRARTVIKMLAGRATEMRTGPFMRLEKLGQPLIRTGVIEPPAAEPQREHEHMHPDETGAEGHPRLPPSI